jgi:uncharacterized OB-fold protein
VNLLLPTLSEENREFWDATREQILMLPWCAHCQLPLWFPRTICAICGNQDVQLRPTTGSGHVYALSIHHRPGPGRSAEDGPYAVVLVDLDEGVRIMSNLVAPDLAAIEVGTAVVLRWEALDDGRHLYMFEPRSE